LFLSHKFINDKYEYFYERDFYFNNKSYRADIVIKAPESIIIIDYKTGQKEHSHEQQILVYKKAYEKLYNQNVLAYLLYTDNMQLILINQ
jgi:ATP-dependent exoDNAse (exonuclease V) beta subunit